MAEREVAIVTGGNKGIGLGIALRFAEEGYNVMIFGRNEEDSKQAQKYIKEKEVECEYFTGDVADKKFVNESVENILAKYGKIDHLINNAGIGILKPFIESTLEEFQMQINTNLFGVYNFTKAVLKGMIERKSGSIINIASLAGKNSFIGGTMYSASKHALLGFARSLMLEVRGYNIRVSTICPGSVYTEFGSGPGNKIKEKILNVEDVAEAVMTVIKLPVRALASEIDLRPTNPK